MTLARRNFFSRVATAFSTPLSLRSRLISVALTRKHSASCVAPASPMPFLPTQVQARERGVDAQALRQPCRARFADAVAIQTQARELGVDAQALRQLRRARFVETKRCSRSALKAASWFKHAPSTGMGIDERERVTACFRAIRTSAADSHERTTRTAYDQSKASRASRPPQPKATLLSELAR